MEGLKTLPGKSHVPKTFRYTFLGRKFHKTRNCLDKKIKWNFFGIWGFFRDIWGIMKIFRKLVLKYWFVSYSVL